MISNYNSFIELENIIRKNLDRRGMDGVPIKGELESGAKELLTSSTVFIVTGFVIKKTLSGETDGPLGAISLAKALEEIGKKVVLISDKYSEMILHNCKSVKNVVANIEIVPYKNSKEFSMMLLNKYNPSHIVGIERPGRTIDERCYSMSGEDISDIVPNTDIIFEKAMELDIKTLAIGDGGNEVGMGKVLSYITKTIEMGDRICASVSTDYLIVAGVSNWGGHGITAALSILTGRMLLHDLEMEVKLLKSMLDAGAVDGCTKKNTLSVDGLSIDENLKVLNELRNCVKVAFKNSLCHNSYIV